MKIFLAYLVVDSPQDTGYNYGAGYVAAVLKGGGHDVRYSVLNTQEDIATFCGRVRDERPGIVGLSSTTAQFPYAQQVARTLRRTTDSLLVCGGVHPTLKPACLEETPELHAIVRGEGEHSLLELADAMEAGQDCRSIDNLWLRDGDGIIRNPQRPFIHDLDSLPFPDKTSLDYQAMIDRAGGANRFIFSRGCTFRCTYCSNQALSELGEGTYFRQETPERALEDIRRDAERFRFTRIVFDDDTISLKKEWFHDFFNGYRREFKYPFVCNIRVGTVDADMLELLKEAGATTVAVGVEHGNEAFRRTTLKRPMANRQIVDTFDLCHRLGLNTYGQVIVGFPHETRKLFLDTVRLCRRLSIRNPASIFQPYPGTELGRICEENGWKPARSVFRERREAVISYPGFSREEIQLCADAFPVLTQIGWIPLWIPLGWTLRLWRLVDLCHYLGKRIWRALAGRFLSHLKTGKGQGIAGSPAVES
jgi:anaerobic magnesium-protoporphyrin IX monomethyl ester cyclase